MPVCGVEPVAAGSTLSPTSVSEVDGPVSDALPALAPTSGPASAPVTEPSTFSTRVCTGAKAPLVPVSGAVSGFSRLLTAETTGVVTEETVEVTAATVGDRLSVNPVTALPSGCPAIAPTMLPTGARPAST